MVTIPNGTKVEIMGREQCREALLEMLQKSRPKDADDGKHVGRRWRAIITTHWIDEKWVADSFDEAAAWLKTHNYKLTQGVEMGMFYYVYGKVVDTPPAQ